MIEIDESFVDSAAPNASAIKNGRGLVLKKKFVSFHISSDGSLIFGECRGSGSSNYQCSCDFVDPANPVHRCSCPSRQFPCKHCLGLMYAYAQGDKFTVGEVPEDVVGKRAKVARRVEKRKAEAASPAKPKKVNRAALRKKIKAQLDGLELLETLVHDIVRLGLGNLNAKTAKRVEEQAKQLGNAYLPGAQAALHGLTKLFAGDDGRFDDDLSSSQRESVYSEALDRLTGLGSLVKQGRAYLERRLEDPELKPETDTAIAAWLGHAWQLRELRDVGLVEKDVELVQLAFNSHDDVARREYVDTGVWMDLASGRVGLTQTFRPYRAAKFIKSDDSFLQVATIPELFTYPGDLNPRIRWEEMAPRSFKRGDYKRIREHAHAEFAPLVKTIKSHLKSPLGDKTPVAVMHFARIGVSNGAADADAKTVLEDRQGTRIALTDDGLREEPPSSHLLRMLPRKLLENQTVAARFRHDLDTGTLHAKPLSIVTTSDVVRLTF